MAELCGATTSTRGKHWKFLTADGSKCYPVKAHNGERSEISDIYIKGLCREFGVDESELRKKL
jgi:hypothetical protein